MKHYQLTITSNNKKSAENCFLFFLNNTSELNLNLLKKAIKKKKRKKVLTILKSPHVNKTAQEQFESRFFSKQINLYTSKNRQFLLLLKKIKIYLFPDVKIKTKFILNKNLVKKTQTNLLNPSNFKLNILKQIKSTNKINPKIKTYYKLHKITNLKHIKHFLKIFDMFSELQKINV